jgi:hypothetical protein
LSSSARAEVGFVRTSETASRKDKQRRLAMADPRGAREAVASEVGVVGAVVNFMGGGAVLKVPNTDLA